MFFVLGFVPCYIAAWVLNKAGVLRIPWEVELAGLDHQIMLDEAAHNQEYVDAEREALQRRLRKDG